LVELDFEAVELAVRRRALRVAARAVEHRLNSDLSDYRGTRLPCRCAQQARYAGRRWKQFETVLGELRLHRAYYHCGGCGQGFCPRDQQLGLAGSCLSPGVSRMAGVVGALVSFQEGSELLRELAGVQVPTKQVERTAESLGGEIAKDERQFVQHPSSQGCLPPTLYLGMDGTGVPMRGSELRGRSGKQPDGSAKTREVKLCTVWSAESRDRQGQPERDEGSVSYSAAIETAACHDSEKRISPFADRVAREAERRGFEQVERRVILGDGAPWIWNIAEELFPDAIQIVDLFHAKQHLSDVSKAIYGPTSQLAKQWAKRRHEQLDAGRLDALLGAVSRHARTCDEARKCIAYIKSNRKRMRYPEFRAAKLCTSTGVVEAGCKLTITTRLKRAGMHWTVRGANAIIALRCCKLSGRFEDFWERRASATGTPGA
jgi:hypothetical protein